ncbi:hypothetical protein K3495_g16196, partial [Podosphaera aphanis]
QDPLLIREDSTLRSIDELSAYGQTSIRYPHQLADPEKSTVSWSNMFDNLTPTIPPTTYKTSSLSANKSSEIKDLPTMPDEVYLTPQSIDTLRPEISHISTSEITESIQDLPDSVSNQIPSVVELGSNNIENNIEQTCDTIAARENEISSRLDEANILPENERRSRKAPRRQIYALARNYEAFHLAMAVTVSNPVIIGRKLPFVSTMKPPPSTWKQMIRHSESDGFKKAAKIEWNTLIEKDTLEMISVDEACQLEQEHQIKSLPLKWVFTYKQDNEGRLLKYKARICVRGDLYRSTRDTFAATLAVSTFRALVSLMAAFDMEIISL